MNRSVKTKLVFGASMVAILLSGPALAAEATKPEYILLADLSPMQGWKNGVLPEKALKSNYTCSLEKQL